MWEVSTIKKIFISLFLFLFLINLVSAVPPITTEFIGDQGLDIQANLQDNYKINEGAELHIYVFNRSNGAIMSHPTVTCTAELTDRNGTEILSGMPTQHGTHFLMTRNASIITEAGIYGVTIVCNTSVIAGYKTGYFEATEGGVDITNGRSDLIIGLLAILVSLLFISLYAIFKIEDYIGKFVFYWISHILFVLINFVAWQIGVEGLLSSIALTGIFKVMFYFTAIAIFPMLILTMVWIFYIHTMNDHMKALIEKGEDAENAFDISRKKRRKFY